MKASLLPITGIGGLPHQSVKAALEYSLKFDIPFLPELPHLDGDMTTLSQNSCLEKFLELTHSHNIRKVQYPSPEINQNIVIRDFKNTKTFIDCPLIHDTENISSIVTGRGLHSCALKSFEEIKDLGISHLSFDARLITDSPENFLKELIRNDITPVVGIISTHDGKVSRVENFTKWKKALSMYSMSWYQKDYR